MSFQLKAIAVAALLLSSTVAFAGHGYKDEVCQEPIHAQLMDSFYVGLQAGYDAYAVDINSSIPAFGANNVDISAKGWVGGIMFGYGKYFNNLYYLGGELFGNLSNAGNSFNITDTDVGPTITYNGKISVDASYGAAMLPGVKLNDVTMAYIRLGYNWANIRYQESHTGVGSSSKSDTLGGFVYGVGLEALLKGNWSVRGEYTYTNYKSVDTPLGVGGSFAPSDNQFMLGVIYHVS